MNPLRSGSRNWPTDGIKIKPNKLAPKARLESKKIWSNNGILKSLILASKNSKSEFWLTIFSTNSRTRGSGGRARWPYVIPCSMALCRSALEPTVLSSNWNWRAPPPPPPVSINPPVHVLPYGAFLGPPAVWIYVPYVQAPAILGRESLFNLWPDKVPVYKCPLLPRPRQEWSLMCMCCVSCYHVSHPRRRYESHYHVNYKQPPSPLAVWIS